MSLLRPAKVIAVCGGKGVVGNSNRSVNLRIVLAELRRRVVLLDADLGLANVDVLLGLQARHTLADVLAGTHSLRDILITGPGGIRVVPAASGVTRMAAMGARQHTEELSAFSELADQVDTLIVDTAAGISDTVVSFVRAAN